MMMKAKDLMTKNPSVVTPDMDLQKIAKLMAKENVGSIPVVDSNDNKKILGIITDRDITIRCVAEGKNPLDVRVSDVMSKPIVTVHQDDDISTVTKTMEKNMVRRVPVVDDSGKVIGIVAQADVALQASERTTGDTVEKISRPTNRPSNVH